MRFFWGWTSKSHQRSANLIICRHPFIERRPPFAACFSASAHHAAEILSSVLRKYYPRGGTSSDFIHQKLPDSTPAWRRRSRGLRSMIYRQMASADSVTVMVGRSPTACLLACLHR